jgi:hypothetical protein
MFTLSCISALRLLVGLAKGKSATDVVLTQLCIYGVLWDRVIYNKYIQSMMMLFTIFRYTR